MHLVTHTIWIGRPATDVFDFFTDFSQASRWRQYVVSMAPIDPSTPIGVGSRLRTEIELMGARETFEMEVLAFNRPSLWRHRTFESDFNGYIEYRFEPEGAGTRVTMTINIKPSGLYGWLGMPLMLLRRERPYAEQLPQLKRVMENER